MSYSKLSKQGKRNLVVMIFALLCFICGVVIGVISPSSEPIPIEPTRITAPVETPKAAPQISVQPLEVPEYTITSLGQYRLTAYCACEKCCGYWATIRPVDDDGNPIVYTANQSIAKQGVTVAADTDILPFNTVILIDDHEYIVQDRGGAIDGRHIDIFFESHEEARQFGSKYQEIFIKEKKQ